MRKANFSAYRITQVDVRRDARVGVERGVEVGVKSTKI